MPKWQSIKPLLASLNGKQLRFDAAADIEALQTLITPMTMGELMIEGFGRSPRYSLAHHIFNTGNLEAAEKLQAKIQRSFQTEHESEAAIGYDNFPFPFDTTQWTNDTVTAGLLIWETLFGTKIHAFLPDLVINALKRQSRPALEWATPKLSIIKKDALRKLFLDILDYAPDTTLTDTYLRLCETCLDNLNPDTHDIRNSGGVIAYAVGCAYYGPVDCRIRRNNTILLAFKSNHDRIAFQAILGEWQKWALFNKSWGQKHFMDTVDDFLYTHANPA